MASDRRNRPKRQPCRSVAATPHQSLEGRRPTGGRVPPEPSRSMGGESPHRPGPGDRTRAKQALAAGARARLPRGGGGRHHRPLLLQTDGQATGGQQLVELVLGIHLRYGGPHAIVGMSGALILQAIELHSRKTIEMGTVSWLRVRGLSNVRQETSINAADHSAHATRVEIDPAVDGGLVYGEDVELMVGVRRVTLGADGVDRRSTDCQFEAFRLVAIPTSAEESASAWSRRALVVAEVPVTRRWLRVAPFRRGSQKGPRSREATRTVAFRATIERLHNRLNNLEVRAGVIGKAARGLLALVNDIRESGGEMLQEVVDALSLQQQFMRAADESPFDLWSSTSLQVCASICDPASSLVHSSSRGFWNGLYYAMGLVESGQDSPVAAVNKFEEQLVNSARASKLLELIGKRRLHKAKRRLILTQDVIDVAPSYLREAARTSLAGPIALTPGGKPPPKGSRKKNWRPRLVVDLMDAHFCAMVEHASLTERRIRARTEPLYSE
jgi:hypothetical protein